MVVMTGQHENPIEEFDEALKAAEGYAKADASNGRNPHRSEADRRAAIRRELKAKGATVDEAEVRRRATGA